MGEAEHIVRSLADTDWAKHLLEERGYIYESKHEGWYSVSDETFYPESQVHLILDPPTGRKIMVGCQQTCIKTQGLPRIGLH